MSKPKPLNRKTLAATLDATMRLIRDYVVLPDPAAVAVTLWIAHAWTFDRDRLAASPYLSVSSPEMQSGKTRTLEVLTLLVPKPWLASNPTVSTLFRTIEDECPTLMIDEADKLFGATGGSAQRSLQGLLNAGNRRGVTMPRVETINKQRVVVKYRIFCPKVLAGIGRLPPTIADRSIPIRLQRKLPTERVKKFWHDTANRAAQPIRQAFATLEADKLPMRRVAVPHALSDRAAEGWEPLLRVAELAGDPWPKLGRQAAITLSVTDDAPTLGLLLLRDLRAVFDNARKERKEDRLATAVILHELRAMDESPWSVKGLGAYMLASMLSPYAIRPHQYRDGKGREAPVVRGYERKDFEQVWLRWL
jgi:hypothetical protein